MIPWSKNSAGILNFVLNYTIMPPTMAPITSMDTAWSASCSLSRYTRMGKSFTFPSQWVTGLWDKGKSKLALAAELVAQAMKAIGLRRQVILLCDSWYPKAEVDRLWWNSLKTWKWFVMPGWIRPFTDFLPLKLGKGPSKKREGPDSLEMISFLAEPKSGDWLIGMIPVITNLERESGICHGYCAQKRKRSRRLFLCTADPRTISFDWENSTDKTVCSYGAENVFYLPLAWYGLRWNIRGFLL